MVDNNKIYMKRDNLLQMKISNYLLYYKENEENQFSGIVALLTKDPLVNSDTVDNKELLDIISNRVILKVIRSCKIYIFKLIQIYAPTSKISIKKFRTAPVTV